MPQLDPTWFASQLFWLVAFFSLLYFLLSRAVLPPLLRVMDERTARISQDLARAEQLKSDAEHARDQYERALADARLRAQSVLTEAAQTMKAQADAANASMDKTLSARIQEAQSVIEQKKQEMFGYLYQDSAGLVAQIVEKFAHLQPGQKEVLSALETAKKTH